MLNFEFLSLLNLKIKKLIKTKQLRLVNLLSSLNSLTSSAGMEDSSINVHWLQCPPRELIKDPFRYVHQNFNMLSN